MKSIYFMASNSQHRRVFVGNIPYDASEEQLVQICEEVGPVVSFRIVVDKETGKPKGYGFCEYKDEETALSARRNLQGYQINGRQLRVDFAENDKNADRNREQGRGGPGMVASVDPQKQFGAPLVLGDAGLKQPIGLSVAVAAASLMAGALGGPQLVLGTDLLTLHLAKMSRNQLNEIISEMKSMAAQNKEQTRQLLLASPQLPKALLQAQIMLGMVTPQMLQNQNIRQASGPPLQPLLQDDEQGHQPRVQILPGVPPLAQNKMQFDLIPQAREGQVPAGHPKYYIHNQYASELPERPQIQPPLLPQHQVLQQGPLHGQSGDSTLPSISQQPLGNLSVRPEMQATASSSVKQQLEHPLLHHPAQVESANLAHDSKLIAPSATLQPSLLTRPPFPDQRFQPSSSIFSAMQDNRNKDSNRPPQVPIDSTWARRVDTYPSLSSGSSEKAGTVHGSSDLMNHPSKLVILDGERSATFLGPEVKVPTSISGPSHVFSMSGSQISKAEAASNSEKQVPQLEVPPEMESALLQQVMNLTPEQLSSLPPDQQQQVIQLQKVLRQQRT